MDKRVKYYPKTDLFFGHNLSKIETMVVPEFEEIDVNDAIEFYQIKKYFDEGVRNKAWTDKAYNDYRTKSMELYRLTNRFFCQISEDNLFTCYNSVILNYRSDFWIIFDKCKLFNRISDEVFESLVTECDINPYDLFLCKNIVRKYGNVLKKIYN